MNTKEEKAMSPYVKIEFNNKVHINQHSFLSNKSNEVQFIDLLKNHLHQHNFIVYQAESDADTLIVHHALKLA